MPACRAAYSGSQLILTFDSPKTFLPIVVIEANVAFKSFRADKHFAGRIYSIRIEVPGPSRHQEPHGPHHFSSLHGIPSDPTVLKRHANIQEEDTAPRREDTVVEARFLWVEK